MSGRPSKSALYLDSIKALRPRQIAARPRRLLSPRLLAVATAPRDLPPMRPLPRGVNIDHAPQGGPAPGPEQTGVFAAVGRQRSFGGERFWEDRADGDLFLFHLHGFAPLADYAGGEQSAEGDRFWRRVIESWLESETTPRRPAWHPYPTSRRLLSWAAAVSAIEGWSGGFREVVAAEIWRQAAYLSRTVEHDIGGNHVLLNSVALCNAGALFEGAPFLHRGLRLLRRELAQQLLADGGHEERSTSYHREIHAWLSDLARILAGIGTRPRWLLDAVDAMALWMRKIAGPDGTLALLNDAWEGPPVLNDDPAAVSDLAASGYIVLRHDTDQAVIDVGPLAPSHLTPHAHADALSFVLWADGEPVLVDPGSFSYTGADRDRFRGTSAHNTVAIDDRDQCEFWADFRAAYLPAVRARPLQRFGDVTVAGGSHDGYRRLPRPVTHHRRFVWCPGNGLVIVDLLRGDGKHQVRSSLHLSSSASDADGRNVGPFTLTLLGNGTAVVSRASYAPYLGVMVETAVIEDRRTIEVEAPFGWSLLRAGAAVTQLTRERLVIKRRSGAEAVIPLDWAG